MIAIKKLVYFALLMGGTIGLLAIAEPDSGTTSTATDEGSITVAAYYFPNYHLGDPRIEQQNGPGWNEWELVKNAKPRFKCHKQPKVPLWGYTDEADPTVMAQKIAAAADNGIDAFIFDWYFYEDGPFLQRGVEDGFMKAANNSRLKFGLMWANHDWIDIFPAHLEVKPKVLYPGAMTAQGFDKMAAYVISTYFKHPSYWLIDGRPYFSIYDLNTLLASFGSLEATRAVLDRFRAMTAEAGFPGLHLNAVVWGQPILPGEKTPADYPSLVTDLGFDSLTSYTWVHHNALTGFPTTEYVESCSSYLIHYQTMLEKFTQPYFPNVSMGWDPTPRTAQDEPWKSGPYPFTGVVVGNTPAAFRAAMKTIKQQLLEAPTEPKVITINCWNEWTEGSYLEPDTDRGMAYLEAVKYVFTPHPH